MPDNNLDILIRILTQEVGPEKTADVLKKITAETGKSTEATKEASKATKLFGEHNKELKKVVQELSREFPIAGAALRAFTSPIGAALTISVGLFVAIKREIAATNVLLDQLEDRAAAAGTTMQQSLATAANNAAQAFTALDIALRRAGEPNDPLNTEMENRIRLLHEQSEAARQLIDAQEAQELARGGGDSAAVRERFAAARSALSSGTMQREFDIRREELSRRVAMDENLIRAAGDATAALHNLREEARRLDLPSQIAAERARLGEEQRGTRAATGLFADRARAQAELEAVEAAQRSGVINSPETVARYRAAAGSATGAITQSQRALADMQARQIANGQREEELAAAAQAAQGAATQNRQRITGLGSQVATDTEVGRIRGIGNIVAGGGVNAQTLNLAGQAADAIRGGGRATREQAEAFNTVARILGMTLDQIARSNDTVEQFRRTLAAYEQRLNAITNGPRP